MNPIFKLLLAVFSMVTIWGEATIVPQVVVPVVKAYLRGQKCFKFKQFCITFSRITKLYFKFMWYLCITRLIKAFIAHFPALYCMHNTAPIYHFRTDNNPYNNNHQIKGWVYICPLMEMNWENNWNLLSINEPFDKHLF